jgi:hypothetical protein
MKRYRVFFLLLFALLFIINVQATFGQKLPENVTRVLDQNHTGWKLVSSESPCEEKSILKGDFDGNNKTDYVVRIHKKGREVGVYKRTDVHVLIFLADEKKDYKVQTIPEVIDLDSSFFTVVKKGQPIVKAKGGNMKFETDTLLQEMCKPDRMSFYVFVFKNGKFEGKTTVFN